MSKRQRDESIIDEAAGAKSAQRQKVNDEYQPKADADSNSPPRASLLGIPPELRNVIYRYALLEISSVEINASNHTRPGLLSVNRQIEREAGGIYFRENLFKVGVVDLKPVMTPSTYKRHWVFTANWTYCASGKYTWKNFMEWMKLLHQDAMFEVGEWSEDHPRVEFEMIHRAAAIVERLKSMPWDVVQATLEDFRRASELASGFRWV